MYILKFFNKLDLTIIIEKVEIYTCSKLSYNYVFFFTIIIVTQYTTQN